MAGVAGGASAFTVFLLYLAMNTAISIQNERNDYLTQQITLEDHQIEKIKGLQDTKQALLARMQIIQQLQQSRPIVVHLFDQLVRRCPRACTSPASPRAATA
jgi:type IV pilus assembly protein PilN